MEGQKEILGLWISKNEGAKFWLSVVNDINNRGTKNIFIACIDGLSGFSEAINAVFPNTQIQRCIVHMIRNSLNFVVWRDKKDVAKDLKAIYTADTEQIAKVSLTSFKAKWDCKYPLLVIRGKEIGLK